MLYFVEPFSDSSLLICAIAIHYDGSGKSNETLYGTEKSFQKRPISQQNILINVCETYNLDLLSKSHFNPSI